MKLRALCFVTATVALGAGCGESHTGDEDAAIVFDATFPDTGVDAGPPPSNVGEPCASDMDCEEPAGLCETGLPGGYCSAICGGDIMCPEGSECVQVDRTRFLCLDGCDPASEEDQCRAGYGCRSGMGIPGVCIPGCEDDSDCSDGALCDAAGGFSGEGACYDPDSSTGDACEGEDDCPSGGFCLSDRFGYPDGYCAAFGCDPDANTGCDGTDQCLPTGRGGGLCYQGCTDDADCTREGYDCQTTGSFPDRRTCQPTPDPSAVDPDQLGQICSAGRGDCDGGACLSESESGWPDSYCLAVGCDPEAASSGCPGDGVCVLSADGTTGLCLDGCTEGTDCRAGYDCRPSDSEDPTSATACLPGCDDDSVCGNDGFECNTGTGMCTEPFVETTLGEPCLDGDDCTGGRCFSEAADGWPAGTCTYPGCRLSGTGPEATCPTGAVCVDDAGGDPELGVCLEGCTVGSTTECRPGYACVELTAGSTEGSCRPACTDSDCGSGRTCSTTTGLCE